MSVPAEESKSSGTYECGCHCGYIKFAMTLSPPLPEYKVLQCNCSACTLLGYLLTYPLKTDVQWHGESKSRYAIYQFNTKLKDQMFCTKCGTSLGIDFRDLLKPARYGISARTIYGINLDKLNYEKGDGINKVEPAGDLSGHQWDEEKDEMR